MSTPVHVMSVEAFDEFVRREENADKLFEYIGGEIVEVPTNQIASLITVRILLLVGMYLLKNDIGHLSGPDHGYEVAGERYAPDVGFISYEKMPQTTTRWFTPHPPEFAVEVVSSDRADENKKLSIKITNYLSTGALVWVVRHEERHVEVHAPGQPVTIFRSEDTLDGGGLLPGLSIQVRDIFAVIKDWQGGERMTLPDRVIVSVDEFDAFVEREENADRSFEYIGGEVFEKMVSNDAAGAVAARIIRFLGVYLDQNDIGEVMADNTGYQVMGERYIPDVSFLSYKNHPDILGVAYRPDPPDIAVEVVSSERNSEKAALVIKVQNYLLANVVVWVVDPANRQVDVYQPGEKPRSYRDGDTLAGVDDLLPGFTLEVSKLFKRLPES